MRNFYQRFLKPLSQDADQAEREIVLNYLLLGVVALSSIALLDTLLDYVTSQNTYLVSRIYAIAGSGLFFLLLYVVARYRHHHTAVAVILTGGVTLLASLVVYRWGLQVPTGIILFSLAIVMGGILIGARYSLYLAGIITIIMSALQIAQALGDWQADLSWMPSNSTAGDVIGFSAIFFIIALVSWLFNRQMELSLRRAWRSEAALKRQKVLLGIKVEQRAQQLEAAQLEKMKELYRFAELGQLSTALFHDLANHLTTVSLDIEGLSASDKSSIMRRISQNVGHIDAIVQQVREQIRGKVRIEVFNVRDEINEVIKILEAAAIQAKVGVNLETTTDLRPSLVLKGDPLRFRQIVLNLVLNGIQAYPTKTNDSRRVVTVGLGRQKTNFILTVTDHGIGVNTADLDKIFRPFYSTKDEGTGIGLFIVRQVVENDFKGTLALTENTKQATTFTVSLPKSYYGPGKS